MHEMSLAENVLQIMEAAAREQGFARVKEIRLEIGELAGVEREALRFCLEGVLHDGIAAQARVEFLTLPGRGWCMQCGKEVPISALYDPCPLCGSPRVQATEGMQMRVRDLLVE